MPRVIAFINEKGGSAKTTLVANLGAYAALKRGRRVLGVEMDPQGHLGRVLGVPIRYPKRSAIDLLVDAALDRPPPLPDPLEALAEAPNQSPILKTRIENFELVVGNKSLALAWGEGSSEAATGALQRALASRPEFQRYDWVLIDAPPSFGPLTLNVLRAADEVVIPVPLTYLGVDGCAQITQTIAMVRERYARPRLRIAMVIPTFYRRTRLAAELLDRLKKRFPKEIAHTIVGYHVRIDEAQSYGLSIFEYAPSSAGAIAMASLAEELELRGATPDGGAP